MGQLLSYSIIASLTLLLAYGGYRLGHGGSPRMRRALLLGIYALALLVVPTLLNVDFGPAVGFAGAEVADGALPAVAITGNGSMSPLNILLIIYLVGVIACALLSVCEFLRMLALMRGAEKSRYRGLPVYLLGRCDVAPFSFGRMIFVSHRDAANPAIMTHESAHIGYGHTLDIFLAQLAATVCWYCPAAWQLRRELKLVHEYQADNAVICAGADPGDYSRLLVQRAAGINNPVMASGFNYHNLKKRIFMMQNPISGRSGGKLRALLPLTAVICAMWVLSLPAVSQTVAQISQATLVSRVLGSNNSSGTFVVYGIDLDSDAVKNGKFLTLTDIDGKEVKVGNVDGVIFPKIGAIVCSDKAVLKRLTPEVKTYMVDGNVINAKAYNKIPSSDLRKVIVSGGAMMVYTGNQPECKFFNPLEDAAIAESKNQ